MYVSPQKIGLTVHLSDYVFGLLAFLAGVVVAMLVEALLDKL